VKGYSAKEVLVSQNETDEETAASKLYIRSHGSYGPGEQKKRGYNWPMDPLKATYGDKGKDIALGGMSQAIYDVLHGKGDAEEKTITSKKYDDFQSMTDLLGRARNLGHGEQPTLEPGHVYGKAAVRRGGGEWDARDCIEGHYEISEQLPDSDLGKTATPGFRNCTTETRRFGCPSVRSDIPKYAKRSIADNQNYGDDVNAQYLLNPSQFAALGIEDEEFLKPRSKEYIKSMFSDCGFDTSDDEVNGMTGDEIFEDIFDSVVDEDGCASIDKYRNMYNQWLLSRRRK